MENYITLTPDDTKNKRLWLKFKKKALSSEEEDTEAKSAQNRPIVTKHQRPPSAFPHVLSKGHGMVFWPLTPEPCCFRQDIVLGSPLWSMWKSIGSNLLHLSHFMFNALEECKSAHFPKCWKAGSSGGCSLLLSYSNGSWTHRIFPPTELHCSFNIQCASKHLLSEVTG